MAQKNANAPPVTFLVPGHPVATAGRAVREVRLQAASRSAGVSHHRVVAVPGQDVVELTVQGPSGAPLRLVLHPDHARDLLASQQTPAGRDAEGALAKGPHEVTVPLRAAWKPQARQDAGAGQRSLAGDLVFGTLKVIGIDLRGAAVDASAQVIVAARDNKVTEGVYRLTTGPLGPLASTPTVKLAKRNHPQLVLIHGTFVDTASTFGKWWDNHPGVIRRLFSAYQDEVYALDHATLGASPIANALTLARALPDNARLHLVTHSRGGLVAEALVRACAGITPADLAFFEPEDGRDYTHHVAELKALGDALRGRNIHVDRVVRVACPAHGTHLASGRLDAYFSVLTFLLEKTLGPLGDDVGQFLNDVARTRMSPSQVPGLEAMLPGRPVTRWLNSQRPPVPGDLRVVAGDVQPNLLEAWIRTLVAYAAYPLFMGDNDLVVDTSAMYGGAARAGGSLYLLDRSAQTDHLHYFSNDITALAVASALLQDTPPGFTPIGPLSAAGEHSSGARALDTDDGSEPAVVLVPGILGSHLRSAQQREWLVWYRVPGLTDRIAWDRPGVTEDGPLHQHYGELIDYLRETHYVLPSGYDWRAPLEDSAAQLASRVTALLDQREDTGQPVRLLAHSMGGMVVRVMKLRHPDVWQRLMAHPDARFVMLGTPNAGSWAPMAICTGDDPFGQMLATLGGWLDDYGSRQVFAQFQGLLDMSAGLNDPQHPLRDRARWQALADLDERAAQTSPWHAYDATGGLKTFYRWAIPAQAALSRAARLRDELDVQALALGDDAQRIQLVLGEARSTLCGVSVAAQGGVEYQATPHGDGRVTWQSAQLEGVRTFRVRAVHADLPRERQYFAGYLQLLQGAARPELPEHMPPAPRSAMAAQVVHWRGRPRDTAHAGLPDEAGLLAAAMGGAAGPTAVIGAASAHQPVQVEVRHGNLKFISEPLVIGHFQSLALTGTEAVVDQIMGGALDDVLRAGLYPTRVGETQVFVNTRSDPANPWGLRRPQAVVVVGLGDESALRQQQLRTAVRRGVLAYAHHCSQSRQQAAQADSGGMTLAITSIGSGGALSVGQASLAVVQGVADANQTLADSGQATAWPGVRKLIIIELYQDRASEAWHTLRDATRSGVLDVDLCTRVLDGNGGLRHPATLNYRGTSYDLVSVMQVDTALHYTLTTRRARSEVRVQATQRPLVDQLISRAEHQSRHDEDLAQALYQLLVPQELRTHLGGATSLVLEVDAATARFPWEMLSSRVAGATGAPASLGWRSQGALVRRLRVDKFRRDPADSVCERVLMVGMSNLESFRGQPLARLPGVQAEMDAVQTALGGSSLQLTPLADPDANDAAKALLAGPWKVVHLSGHGINEVDKASNERTTGMLISGTVVLGPTEMQAMDSVPELVFVNCCHLGKIAGPGVTPQGVFAASVAQQLISDGVRCVVAAGWAVDDAGAAAFAKAFYEMLLHGQGFADAVQAARSAARRADPGGNTWAAYQCYGDPDWKLVAGPAVHASALVARTVPSFATCEELLLALESLSSRAADANPQARNDLHDELQDIIQSQGAAQPQWLAAGRVTEAVADAWRDLGNTALALQWYEMSLNAPDGRASLAALEQWLNIRARTACNTQAEFDSVIAEIARLVALAPTAGRYAILGSAHKRAALKSTAKADSKSMRARLQAMHDAYAQAERLNEPDVYHHATQRLLAQACLAGAGSMSPAQAALHLDRLRQLRTHSEATRGADFWTTVAVHELDLLEALLGGTLAQRADALLQAFTRVHQRVNTPHLWAPVADTWNFVLRFNSPAQG